MMFNNFDNTTPVEQRNPSVATTVSFKHKTTDNFVQNIKTINCSHNLPNIKSIHSNTAEPFHNASQHQQMIQTPVLPFSSIHC